MTPAERQFLEDGRIGHLATATADGAPHVVPVCYALSGGAIWIALDEKPKSVRPRRLKRARNIMANPRASLVVDVYDDADWSRLAWVMVRGAARLVDAGPEHGLAVAALRRRYAQYRDMRLEECVLIAIVAERTTSWGGLAGGAWRAREDSNL